MLTIKLWNCPDTDPNGELLMEKLEEADFCVINTQTLSRQGCPNQRNSNIDLLINKIEMLHRFS